MTAATPAAADSPAALAQPPDTPAPTPVIVVGAGLAGWTTVREFRKLDATTPLTLITADAGDFYAKPSLSNALVHGKTPDQLVSTAAASMAAAQNITLLAFTQVVSIDAANRTVVTEKGRLAYRQLVLATGAQPIRVPVAGGAAGQVLSVNSLDDYKVFHARLTRAGVPQRVVIMGAGLIGCEFANDLAARGHQVSVADPAALPMAALLPAQASLQLQAALSALGVTWHFGATVQSVEPLAGNLSQAGGLRVGLSSGQTLEADLVLSAIGLRADTRLAAAAGLQVERGIVVNTALATSDPHIYALGDGAQYASAGNRSLPYVMPIMQAAKVLAKNLTRLAISGGESSPETLAFPLMPVTIKTPALPILVAAPAPGTPGEWQTVEPGVWRFVDSQGQQRGFVLTGPQTARRGEWTQTTLSSA